MTEPESPMASPIGQSRFPVTVEGFTGSLEHLLLRAQRGDLDVRTLPVAEVTAQVRNQIERGDLSGDLGDAAEALTLLARLVSLKARRVLPDGTPEDSQPEVEPAAAADRRLAEYRLFRAAADALLTEPASQGALSFLGLVAPEVIPVERLRIPPQRLAAAFRDVLVRLQDVSPLPVGAVTFSVEEKVVWLRGLLEAGPVDFKVIFSEVTSRLEAVACFLGLLELLKRGEAEVAQESAFAPIRVSPGG